MRYFSLLIPNEHRHLTTPARDREHALAIFGRELGCSLSVGDEAGPAEYLLDEWDENPHWVNHKIPVSSNALQST